MLHNLIKNDYYDSQINGIPNVDVILKMQNMSSGQFVSDNDIIKYVVLPTIVVYNIK